MEEKKLFLLKSQCKILPAGVSGQQSVSYPDNQPTFANALIID